MNVAQRLLAGLVLPKNIEATRFQGVIVAYGFVSGLEVTFNIYEFSPPRSNCVVQWQRTGRTWSGDWPKCVWGESSRPSAARCHYDRRPKPIG